MASEVLIASGFCGRTVSTISQGMCAGSCACADPENTGASGAYDAQEIIEEKS